MTSPTVQQPNHHHHHHHHLNTTTMMTLDYLRSMRIQEHRAYHISSPSRYFMVSHCTKSTSDNVHGKMRMDEDDNVLRQDDFVTYMTWRCQMISWFYTIAETCRFQKETVEIAMSIVDRYVEVHHNQSSVVADGTAYQLICMTSLYLAAKLHEQYCLTPHQLESLSNDRITAKDIEATEIHVLQSIQWRVNPPTAMAFARLLLDLIPTHYIADTRDTVMEMVQSQIQLAIPDEYLCSIKASSIAMASLMNALHCIIPKEDHLLYYSVLFMDALELDRLTFKPQLELLQRQLRTLVVHSLHHGDLFCSSLLSSSSLSCINDHSSFPKNNQNDEPPKNGPRSPRSVIVSDRKKHIKVLV